MYTDFILGATFLGDVSVFLANGYNIDLTGNSDGTIKVSIDGRGLPQPLEVNIANADGRCQ